MRDAVIEVDRTSDGLAVVLLHGEQDFASAPHLRDELARALDEGRSIVLELSIVSFIDSTILGVIIGALRRAREGSLGFAIVVSPSPASGVVRVLETTGLLAVFPTFSSREQALEAARAGRNQPALAG